jgi:pentatricopeptide repeat protein
LIDGCSKNVVIEEAKKLFIEMGEHSLVANQYMHLHGVDKWIFQERSKE